MFLQTIPFFKRAPEAKGASKAHEGEFKKALQMKETVGSPANSRKTDKNGNKDK